MTDVRYGPVPGHTMQPERDGRGYVCSCGLPLGRTRKQSLGLFRAHKVNLR